MMLETAAVVPDGPQLAKAYDMYALALAQPLAALGAIAARYPALSRPAQEGEWLFSMLLCDCRTPLHATRLQDQHMT